MKNFLQRLAFSLSRGMQGKNGPDSLGYASVGAAIILILLDFFLMTGILSTLAMVCLFYAMFRQFSSNVVKRRQENETFLRVTKKPRQKAQLLYKRIKFGKTTAYFTCEECGTVFSLPKGKGKVRATCPKCHKQSIRNT